MPKSRDAQIPYIKSYSIVSPLYLQVPHPQIQGSTVFYLTQDIHNVTSICNKHVTFINEILHSFKLIKCSKFSVYLPFIAHLEISHISYPQETNAEAPMLDSTNGAVKGNDETTCFQILSVFVV